LRAPRWELNISGATYRSEPENLTKTICLDVRFVVEKNDSVVFLSPPFSGEIANLFFLCNNAMRAVPSIYLFFLAFV
jgi:hypothetical protein